MEVNMDGERAYWAGLSGLPQSASVADCMVAAGQDVPVPRSYFVGLSGLTPEGQFSYAEHKRAVYAGGGGGGDALYGTGLYGSGIYNQ